MNLNLCSSGFHSSTRCLCVLSLFTISVYYIIAAFVMLLDYQKQINSTCETHLIRYSSIRDNLFYKQQFLSKNPRLNSILDFRQSSEFRGNPKQGTREEERVKKRHTEKMEEREQQRLNEEDEKRGKEIQWRIPMAIRKIIYGQQVGVKRAAKGEKSRETEDKQS